jgi:hypothetical protein
MVQQCLQKSHLCPHVPPRTPTRCYSLTPDELAQVILALCPHLEVVTVCGCPGISTREEAGRVEAAVLSGGPVVTGWDPLYRVLATERWAMGDMSPVPRLTPYFSVQRVQYQLP